MDDHLIIYDKTILFLDIVSSSLLWKEKKADFYMTLLDFEKMIVKKTETFEGTIIKTIGDAFMIAFEKLEQALLFAISLQCLLLQIQNKPDPEIIKIILRIGIAKGDVNKRTMIIQNCEHMDYYGEAVNIASRMESKVAKPNEIAFTVLNEEEINEEKIFYIINKASNIIPCNMKINLYQYLEKIKNEKTERGITYRNSNDLKGVGEVTAYSISLEYINPEKN